MLIEIKLKLHNILLVDLARFDTVIVICNYIIYFESRLFLSYVTWFTDQ